MVISAESNLQPFQDIVPKNCEGERILIFNSKTFLFTLAAAEELEREVEFNLPRLEGRKRSSVTRLGVF